MKVAPEHVCQEYQIHIQYTYQPLLIESDPYSSIVNRVIQRPLCVKYNPWSVIPYFHPCLQVATNIGLPPII